MALKLITVESFDWTSEDERCSIHFDITAMLAAIAEGRLRHTKVITDLDRDFAETWLPLRDIKQSRIEEIMRDKLRYNEPLLGVWLPDGTVLTIDGSHRFMARFLANEKELRYHLIADGDWQPYAKITGELPCG